MIVTFTMNPAVDRTLIVPDFEPGKINHVEATYTDAGGNGVNICRALKVMGTESMNFGFIAGQYGRFIKDYLSSQNIPYDFIEVPGDTRLNIKIVGAGGVHTDLNSPGFTLTDADLSRLSERMPQYIRRDNIIVLCGSTPPNFSVERYGEICQAISARGCELFLDTSGDYLLEGLKAGPVFVKPNLTELETTLGRKLSTREEICEAGRELLRRGAKNVAVSLAAEGAIFLNDETTLFVKTPEVQVLGPVGAGDVMVAGLLHARHNGMSFEDMARFSVAAASASVTVEATRMAPRHEVLRLFGETSVEYI